MTSRLIVPHHDGGDGNDITGSDVSETHGAQNDVNENQEYVLVGYHCIVLWRQRDAALLNPDRLGYFPLLTEKIPERLRYSAMLSL